MVEDIGTEWYMLFDKDNIENKNKNCFILNKLSKYFGHYNNIVSCVCYVKYNLNLHIKINPEEWILISLNKHRHLFTNIFLCYILKAENTQLDAKFIEFQMSLMKVKEWLTKADSAISSHDHLPVIQRLSEYEQEKMKVGCLENSLLFIDIVYTFFHFF